jgi:hypothetical protein
MNDRDPVVDTVRALAVLGVVLGHWLVTSVVAGPDGLTIDSPLRTMPQFTPVSWVLQTLGLFFFVGGFAAARSTSPLVAKARRLAIAVAVLLGVWSTVLLGLSMRGIPQSTVELVIHLVTTPLWFFGVYLVLSVLTPLCRWLDRRIGVAAVLLPVALAVLDFGLLNVIAVWWAPWQLGVVVARLGMRRSWGVPMLVVGIAGYALLVRYGGYSPSAVGVPGRRSNLWPPTLTTLSLAIAQIGLVLLVRPAFLPRIVRWVNGCALPIFLLHQSALLAVTLLGTVFGTVPGLHTAPDGPLWLGQRLLWLPVFGLVTWVLLRNGRQQRQHDGGDVQRDAELVRHQHEQGWDTGQRDEQPGQPAVAGARPRGVQEVPAQQQVDEVL